MLNISDNQISDITPLKNLIEKIGITNIIFKDGIYLNGNPLETPPLEIVEQGTNAVLEYFKNIEEQGSQKLNEAKLIVVGEPESGKTTLSKMLRDSTFMPSVTPTTLGIEVDSWKFKDPNEENKRELIANIWDFGGQEIQYMTHQFFLTPDALYVLVTANDRKESSNFPYWFKIIHLLGESKGKYSPVLVVKNRKHREYQFDFDLEYYKKMYPELQIEVIEVDLSKRDSHYASMEQKIKEMIASLPTVNEQRPARWADIQDNLYANNKAHISFDEFEQICNASDVNREASQMLLSSYLHMVGSLLHFSEDTILRNFIILKPQWAVEALYALLSDEEIATSNGRFSKEKYDEIWSAYSVDERGKLFALLLKDNFEICYEIDKQKNIYLAPQFLSNTKATYVDLGDDYLYYRFKYTFMPYGIIERLIVRLSENIKDDLVWKKGLILEKNGAVAEVIQEENRDGLKVIDIKVYGSLEQRKYLLHEVREEIKKIHGRWFRNISFDEMVPCICSECIGAESKEYYKISTIKKAMAKNVNIQCQNSFEQVNSRELLEGIKVPDLEENETDKKPTFVINNIIPEPKPIPGNPKPPEVKKSPFYKKWWFISLIGGLFTGVGTYLWLGKLLPSLGVAIVAFLVVIFFNPKRRFFRVGLLLLGIGGSTFLPIVNKLIGKYLGIDLDPNPWIGGLMIVVAFGLFILDYLENKNE